MPYKRADSPYWWVNITPPGGGEPIRRSTRTQDRQEAEALEGKWRAELYKQQFWGKEPERTFAEVASEYLLASQAKRSLSDIQLRVGHLYDYLGAKKVMSSLSGADVREYTADRRAAGAGPATINRELSILSAMINHAMTEMEWTLPNPVKGRFLKEPPGRVRWITEAEADRLIDAARTTREGDRLADFIVLALNTGGRKNELLKLEWRRVNWEHALITLEPDDTKSGKRRTIPLNEDAVAALKRRYRYSQTYCAASPWVFCKRDGSRYVYPNPVFKKACEKARIVDFRIHDLRHTCASWLVSRGVPLADVKDVLGHSTINMTERYAHLAPHRAREAVARLGSRSSHAGSPVGNIEELIGRSGGGQERKKPRRNGAL